MATAAQLYAARNAGLKLAHVTQPYAQGDIPLANESAAAARAVVKAAADEAIVASTAIGGSAPAGFALVQSGLLTGITATGTGTKVTLTVADGAITAVTLSV